jgi:hypothetical protein
MFQNLANQHGPVQKINKNCECTHKLNNVNLNNIHP